MEQQGEYPEFLIKIEMVDVQNSDALKPDLSEIWMDVRPDFRHFLVSTFWILSLTILAVKN